MSNVYFRYANTIYLIAMSVLDVLERKLTF